MKRYRPHHLNPRQRTARVVLAYKNFAVNKNISHIGLGVAALNTCATLRRLGYWVEIWPIVSAQGLASQLDREQAEAFASHKQPISHVVISAPWIPTTELQGLLMTHANVNFAVVSHSNMGFLMADPRGINLLREGLELQRGHHNFTVAGNCTKFVRDWSSMYGVPIAHLPNLYDVTTIHEVGHRLPWHRGETLRVGIFGATRPLKNMVSAVAAAIELGNVMKTDVEIHTSSGRTEGGGTVRDAILQMTSGLRHTALKEVGWCSWPAFRQAVRGMHVLFSPSYTESFNMVTADGIAEGVASVVSNAIDWAPHDWVANADDVGSIARTARRLLSDAHAVSDGQTALRHYVEQGSQSWIRYLGGDQ